MVWTLPLFTDNSADLGLDCGPLVVQHKAEDAVLLSFVSFNTQAKTAVIYPQTGLLVGSYAFEVEVYFARYALLSSINKLVREFEVVVDSVCLHTELIAPPDDFLELQALQPATTKLFEAPRDTKSLESSGSGYDLCGNRVYEVEYTSEFGAVSVEHAPNDLIAITAEVTVVIYKCTVEALIVRVSLEEYP